MINPQARPFNQEHNLMQPPNEAPCVRRRLGRLALLYLLLILYSSTVIGPTGPNFVYLDPSEAWHRFLAIRFIAHGSDQRADWIGNLLMLVPFGFLVMGVLWPRQPILRAPAMLTAILTCLTAIVAIKYLQLFFPPRTVTLNYITAQTVGAVIGCLCFPLLRAWFARSTHDGDPVTSLVLVLRLYVIVLLAFLLMPLDFALDAADLGARFARLPETILVLPGPDRPMGQRAIVILVSTVAFMPMGMLLTFVKHGTYRVCRRLPAVAGLGLAIATGVYALSVLVISAFPVMPAILYRTCGMVAGAALIRWLARQDPALLLRRLRRLVPWAILPYIACVLVANRLLSTQFLTLHQAVAQASPLGFLPLFDYYIVTKAQAAKNIIGHAALYMPIGVLLWLRYGERGSKHAFLLAATVSFAAEATRYLRPGLEGDINAVFLAGLASMLAARSMPMAWSMVQALKSPSPIEPASIETGHSMQASAVYVGLPGCTSYKQPKQR